MYNECHALLEYLVSSPLDLTEPLIIFQKMEDELKYKQLDQTEIHEKLLMTKSRLSFLHTSTSRAYQASTMRDILQKAITLFPNNTAFLSLYTWNEARTKLDNRVRTILHEVVLKDGEETTLRWVFAIWAEMQINPNRRANQNAIRNLFERAVECER